MRELTLIGLGEDGTHLVLAGPTGEQYRVPADERLRATLRNDRARLGQLEIEMDTALRPRDIQARIRRGESPDAVAEAAGVGVEKIMTYAVPVLAEREHVAQRARASSVRRKHVQGTSVLLGETADASLGAGPDGLPADVAWDSWRRDDGRWTVVVRRGEALAGTWCFDPAGRYVVAEDDGGRSLVGDVPLDLDATDRAITGPSVPLPVSEPEDEEPGVTSLRRARARRALAQEQLAIDGDPAVDAGAVGEVGDDVVGAPAGPEAHETTVDLSETAEQVRAADDRAVHDRAAHDRVDKPVATTASGETVDPDADLGSETGDAQPRSRGRRRERRRVPSWDEIMFGDQRR